MLTASLRQSVPQPFFKKGRAKPLKKPGRVRLPVFATPGVPRINRSTLHEQAQACLKHIQDPLWKHVCTEFQHVSPYFVLKLWKCQLGVLSGGDESTTVHCPNQKVVDFIQAYDFIILGSLRQYFPTLKAITFSAP